MTTLIENATQIAAAIAAMPEVESARVWASVPGKERIYVEVIRTDIDGKRYGGSGGQCWVDLNTGAVLAKTDKYNGTFYCNSFTKAFHVANSTTDKIRAVVAGF
ncbi:hypothetical protein [Methylobrevis pamukkalensis]|uniref:Uncharacterized protein n=1 Tax=Methylobrevis pamukkalensis TaxID=1439726 RepID=A0A1E3GZU8_9HYPH|nr:hypothetical protein [Methylobrevis pamukkalensis]ODN69577.1 hypothetical protein A6302_03123 [Methylobrevis pamukkalensis]